MDDKWSVPAQRGPLGSTLQSDVKTSNTIYEEAKRVYERILREKAGKGYQIAQATANGDAAISDQLNVVIQIERRPRRRFISPFQLVRNQAYLAAHQGREAAAEFQKIIDHRGIVLNGPIGALAQLQIARA